MGRGRVAGGTVAGQAGRGRQARIWPLCQILTFTWAAWGSPGPLICATNWDCSGFPWGKEKSFPMPHSEPLAKMWAGYSVDMLSCWCVGGGCEARPESGTCAVS